MRNTETHFEQVSFEVVEEVLRRATPLASKLEKSPAPPSAEERDAVTEVQQEKSTPSNGQR
jgi:hypothetical protein